MRIVFFSIAVPPGAVGFIALGAVTTIPAPLRESLPEPGGRLQNLPHARGVTGRRGESSSVVTPDRAPAATDKT
jgi:hypothetical protein